MRLNSIPSYYKNLLNSISYQNQLRAPRAMKLMNKRFHYLVESVRNLFNSVSTSMTLLTLFDQTNTSVQENILRIDRAKHF